MRRLLTTNGTLKEHLPLSDDYLKRLVTSFHEKSITVSFGNKFVIDYASELECPFDETFTKFDIVDEAGRHWSLIGFHAGRRWYEIWFPVSTGGKSNERSPLLFCKGTKPPSPETLDKVTWTLYHLFESVAAAS